MTAGLANQAGKAFIWKLLDLSGAKLIYLARVLILARILVPDDFGLMAIALSALAVIQKLTDFGMSPALVQQADPSEAHYDAAWTVGLARAITITLVMLLAAPLIALLFSEPRATGILRLMALRPLVESLQSVKIAHLTRTLSFRSLALINIPGALGDLLVSVLLAPALGVWALAAGSLSGVAVNMVLSYFFAPHTPRLVWDPGSIQSLSLFGRWIFLTGIAAVAGSSIVQWVISRRLGTEELGLYYLATKLAFLPYEVASGVIGAVAFPLYARLQTDLSKTARAFRMLLTVSAVLLIPTYLMMIVLAPALVNSVLGPGWAGTQDVIRVLALGGLIGLLGDAAVPILKGLGHPEKVLVLEMIQSSVLILLAWSLAGRFGLNGAAFAWLPAFAATQAASLIMIKQIIPQPFYAVARSIVIIVMTSLVSAGLAWLVVGALPGLLGLVISILLGGAVLFTTFWWFERRFSLGLAAPLQWAFPQIADRLGFSLSDTLAE